MIGLGKFGLPFGLSMMARGHRVIGLDLDEGRVRAAQDLLSRVCQGDAADTLVLEQLGFQDLNHVVLGVGGSMAASILAALNLTNTHKVMAVAVKAPQHIAFTFVPDSRTPLRKGDTLVLIGKPEALLGLKSQMSCSTGIIRPAGGVAMFAPLPTPREMAAWDRAAVALGLPEVLLMENAARAAAVVLAEWYGAVAGKRVLLFMGAGNNGGDAACLARHLHDAGAEVMVLHTRPLGSYKGCTGQHLRLARNCGVQFLPVAAWPSRFRDSAWLRPDVVVDGLLGTGFGGALRDLEAGLVEQINQLGQRAFVLALDIPSGLDGMTGRPSPTAVRAQATATFAAAKPGLIMPDAARYVGRLRVCDIGMPRSVREGLPPSFRLITESVLRTLPQPGALWHKGRAGHVVVAGGSEGLCGAPHLAALGALRTGAGLVTVAAPGPLLESIRGGTPDIMSLNLGPGWDAQGAGIISPLLNRAGGLVCGPGIGRTPEVVAFLAGLLAMPDRPPTVIDADALFALAGDPALMAFVRSDDILTPHPGEAALLLGLDNTDGRGSLSVQADRPSALAELTRLAPCIWVLKGAGTLIGRREEVVSVCPVAAPNLAVGGAGDVLAGCLAALLAQRMPPELAACAGVMLHARAGQHLAQAYPHRGNTASEIAHALAVARG